MANLTSTLTVKLLDEISKPAKSVAEALSATERKAKEVAKALAGSGATDRLSASLTKLGLSAKDVDTVARSFKEYAASARLAGTASDWTKTQAAGVRRWEAQTVSALKTVQREQAAFARTQRRFTETSGGGGGHGDASGRQMLVGIAGTFAAEKIAHFGKESLHTYREFDKERRYAKAVMAISDKDQEPLITQAIHGGATSKFNDIQWLEAQRELADRGLNVKQVLAITQVAATLGQTVDKTLPEASRLLEGGMFGFGKDTSTYEKALANAKRTADLQVKASKISGMNAEDVSQTYKYGAAPFRMGGLSEEQLLAFAAVGKKANMGGDEMGVAARALVANILKPTAGARTAMLANRIDFSKYQKLGAQPMKVEPFAQSIAGTYGVALSEKAKQALQKVFDDKAVVGSAAKFMPAIMKVLGASLGGDDAKSKKSIAGEARRYRDSAMEGVDAQGLFNAMIPAIAKNPALANILFGSKQGARIRTAIGDPVVFMHKLDQLKNQADGYAGKISEERMAGFDGAVSRFEGAVLNLQTAVGRSFDNDGKGGMITSVADRMGAMIQAMAEAPPALQRLGVEAGAVAGIFAGMKGAEALMGGFGLKGSAMALTEAAHALMGAAVKDDLGNGLPGGSKKKGFFRHAGKALAALPILGGIYEAGKEAYDYADEEGYIKAGRDYFNPTVSQPRLSGAGGVGLRASRPSPYGGLAGVTEQAGAAKTALDALNMSVTPIVDASGLAPAVAQARELLGLLHQISGAASGASAAVRGIDVPSLGKVQRGDFTFGGVGGGN